MIDDEPQDTPPEEPAPEAEAPAPEAEAPSPAPEVDEDSPSPAPEAPTEEAPAEEPPAEEAPAPTAEEAPAPAEEAPAPADEPAEPAPAAEQRPDRRERNPQRTAAEPDVIPGAHLEPDLVLDESAAEEADPYADPDATPEEQAAEADEAPQPLATTIIDLAADARYLATGKRKRAVARVTIKPGTGVYTVNGKELDAFFPRPTLQRACRGPLETVGQQERLDVVAKIHGGGVSAQAGALRHGIARALVEADPNLRGELKRRGFLTRDPRVKERKKAGLKKARKRPQFSKR
jgi:small subunit ribosomal protein S9